MKKASPINDARVHLYFVQRTFTQSCTKGSAFWEALKHLLRMNELPLDFPSSYGWSEHTKGILHGVYSAVRADYI
jgi:hypothetical protein